jgi:hypothetical protein
MTKLDNGNLAFLASDQLNRNCDYIMLTGLGLWRLARAPLRSRPGVYVSGQNSTMQEAVIHNPKALRLQQPSPSFSLADDAGIVEQATRLFLSAQGFEFLTAWMVSRDEEFLSMQNGRVLGAGEVAIPDAQRAQVYPRGECQRWMRLNVKSGIPKV